MALPQSKPIGQIAQKAVNRALTAAKTDSALPSVPWQGAAPPLQMPMSVEQADRLQAWALSVPVRQPSAEVSEIANHLEYMLAALPTRASDEEDGKKRLAVYVRLLRPFGDDALAHMARRACEELDWFPSARWCVEAARSHRGLTADRATALALAQRYRQQRFTDWLRNIRDGSIDQAEIDAAPERHRRLAEEQGLLRFDSATGQFHIPSLAAKEKEQ